jgi:hypothetical protein
VFVETGSALLSYFDLTSADAVLRTLVLMVTRVTELKPTRQPWYWHFHDTVLNTQICTVVSVPV